MGILFSLCFESLIISLGRIMQPSPRLSMQSRVITFVAIVGLAMIVAALLFSIIPAEGEGDRYTAQNLRATSDALDERATEIAQAATRLAPGAIAQSVAPVTPGPESSAPATPPVDAASTSRRSPVALGERWETVDGLDMLVLGVDGDAWPRVQAENQFNDAPPEGMRMVMAHVEVTNLSGDANTPRSIGTGDFRMVGDRGIVYAPFESTTRCGVIPDELDWELFGGATVSGNICVIVAEDEGDLRLIYHPGYEWGDQVVYFDLGE